MDCQALSPVMSPVKQYGKQRIYWLENTHENLTEIHEALLEEWDNNPQKCSTSNGEYVVNSWLLESDTLDINVVKKHFLIMFGLAS